MANKHVNVVVIGAGAGGGIVAKELSVAGLSVILFERGKWQTFFDHDNDELISQRSFPLKCAYGPDNERYWRVVQSGIDSWRIAYPNEWPYGNNAACVGGGTLSYGAMAWRFMPEDFTLRSTYGHVEGSTIEDWPLTYEDLEPYYERAEYEIGVSGDEGSNVFGPPRKKPFPMPAFSLNKEGEILEKAALSLGYHPFPIPMLRNSVSYGGRPACIRMRTCVGFACPVNAKCGTQNTVLPIALKTGNCELRTESKVSEILLDDTGRARGIKYFDKNDKQQTQTSDIVVLCCSATETARLLLNSKSKLFPNGAGNSNGWVGHNLQDHTYCGAEGLFEDEVYDDVGPGACIAIKDFVHNNPGIIGGAMLANEFIRMPYLYANDRPPGAPSWGIEHKQFQKNYFKKNISVKGPVQEMPVFENMVEIDPKVKDYWGIPVLRVSGYRHENNFIAGRYVAEKAETWLKKAGAKVTWQTIPGQYAGASQHQAGTCRMGNDPKTSVTNRYGQLHEVDNIFVADGSLHVTNGGFNPALTIMALAYWVSDYINDQWKGSKFK
ncbi:MAG: GMC family oxidoreductase [Bacteroidales bacterium]|nr:GMC family oxidoreductase [Bacteroidales bacterium]